MIRIPLVRVCLSRTGWFQFTIWVDDYVTGRIVLHFLQQFMTSTQFVTFNNCLKVCYQGLNRFELWGPILDSHLRTSLRWRLQVPCVVISWLMFGDVLSLPMVAGDLLWLVCIQTNVLRVVLAGLSVCLVGGYCYSQTTTKTAAAATSTYLSSMFSGKFIVFSAILSLGSVYDPSFNDCFTRHQRILRHTSHFIAGVLSMYTGSLHDQQVAIPSTHSIETFGEQ